MRNKNFWMLLGGMIMLMIVICIFSQYNPRLQQQRALAKKWNVEIENYPHPHYFPYGYFEEILEPGTGINEVHQIAEGVKVRYFCKISYSGRCLRL